MFKQLSPRGVILPLNYRNTVPGPSSVLIHSSPWALYISWESQLLFIWSSRKGLGARMGLFWRVFRALQDRGQSNTFLSTDIYFIIFKLTVHPNLAAKKSMWKHYRKIISEKIWLPCDSWGLSQNCPWNWGTTEYWLSGLIINDEQLFKNCQKYFKVRWLLLKSRLLAVLKNH